MVDFTLTAITTGLGGSGDISYEWKRNDGTVIGTNQNTYTIVAADIGNTITVTVTRTGLSGPVTSTPTGTVIEQPNYGITLDPSVDKTFADAIVGSAVEPYTLTVQNTGKQLTGALSVSLTGDSGNFELSSAIISSIAVGGSATFTVKPKNASGDAVKKYQAIVEVSNANISANIIVDFTPFHATVSFDSTGGSAVASYTNREYGTVTKPADPTKAFTVVEGLYTGKHTDPNPPYAFDGWFAPGASTPFDFTNTNITADITLTAKWTSPLPPAINVDSQAGANIVDKAVAYVKANAAADKEYTLFIANDYNVTPAKSLSDPMTNVLNIANFKLTIIGLGSERQIKLSSIGVLFGLGHASVELTIGNNITLVGRKVGGNGNENNQSGIVIVQNGTFTMLDGSKITGNTNSFTTNEGEELGTGAGVSVQKGTFIMDGGIISGNTATYYGGGVDVDEYQGGKFYMVNGTIYGSNETDPELKNTAPSGAAFSGEINYGTFSGAGGAWVSNGTLDGSDNTVRVVNGNLE
jgi:uncharacterized repeat protein (TIGR02543 family)